MPFKFEKFVETNTSFDAKITVRQRTGQLGFSAGAVNRFQIAQYRFAVLYFDPGSRVVGIELKTKEEEGAIAIHARPSNTYISAKNFLDKYSVDYSVSHRHELQHDKAENMLYFFVDREASIPDDAGGDESSDKDDAAATSDFDDF